MARNKQVDREKVLIGKIGKTCCGGTPSSKHPEYFRGTIPWIGTTALNGKRIDESDAVKLITEEAVANSATKLIPANSIMVGIRVGVGKVAINSVPMCTSQDIVSIVGVDDSIWSKEYVALAIKFFAPALADGFIQQLGERRIGQHQPAARRDAIGDRVNFSGMME